MRFKFRAECQHDIIEFLRVVIEYCEANTPPEPPVELAAGPNGLGINRELVDCGFDLDELRRRRQERLDAGPPHLYCALVEWNARAMPGFDGIVEIDTSLPLDRLLALMREIADSHVMRETLAAADEYTGDRTYTEDA